MAKKKPRKRGSGPPGASPKSQQPDGGEKSAGVTPVTPREGAHPIDELDAGPRLPRWARWAAFLSLVGLHAFLLVRVANPSPHAGGDNAGYLTLAYSLIENGEYTDLYDPAQPAHTKYPPVYAMVLAMAMALGARTWTAFKTVSAVAVLVSVALAAGWAWRRRGWSFGITIGVLLAFANTFLYHSQWILSDPVFLAFTLVALLAFDRVDALARPGIAPSAEGSVGEIPDGDRRWLVLGCAAAILAFFTRSAGVPLVLAVFGWLLLRKQKRALIAFAIAFGVPAFLWWIRSRALGGPGYAGEFWLVNPYQPDLGRAGPLRMVERLASNAWLYVGTEIPAGLTGARNLTATFGGLVLFALAVVGWIKRLRFAGVAELFVPLYLGLILLWPEVWSGDRFALPLFAPILFYAGETIVRASRPFHRWAPHWVSGAVAIVILIPAVGAWRTSARQAAICRDRVQVGAFGCYRERMQEFVSAAEWSTQNLPDGAVVFTRKPRIFYLLSGVPSAVFPFSDDPQVLADAAIATGARYVIVDYLDSVSAFYIVPALEKRTGMFCSMIGFGGDDRGIQTQLLGIDPTAEGDRPVSEEGGALSVQLGQCPATAYRGGSRGPRDVPQSDASGFVPLLRSLDS